MTDPVLGKTPVNTGEWFFVAATFDSVAQEMKVYVNGVFENVKERKEGELPIIEEPVKIGVMDEAHGANWWFTGLIDEVAILDAVLGEDDLKAIMNLGLDEAISTTAVSVTGKLATTWAAVKAQ